MREQNKRRRRGKGGGLPLDQINISRQSFPRPTYTSVHPRDIAATEKQQPFRKSSEVFKIIPFTNGTTLSTG